MESTIEKKEYDEKEFKALITQALKTKQDGATPNDMVLATGLPKDWVEFTLRKLLDDYPCRLNTTPSGELIYIFDFSNRKERPFGEVLKDIVLAFFKGIWFVFTVFFKAWIILMLFTYLLFNVIVLVIGITAITRSGELLEGMFKFFGSIIKDGFNSMKSGVKVKSSELNFVFSYVFGETIVPPDKLALEKKILSFIKKNNGVLVNAHLVELTGCTLNEAEEKATRLMADYHGEVEVNEQGVIIYRFNEVLTDTSVDTVDSPFIWDTPYPLRKMNDNDKDTNQAIAGVNGFNLVMAIVSPLIIELVFMEDESSMSDEMLFISLVIPFVFSFLFYLIPLCRKPFINFANRKIKAQNQALFVLREIFKRLPKITPEKDAQNIAKTLVEKEPDTKTITKTKQLLERHAINLRAESNIGEDKELHYEFKELFEELEAVKS